ncbi:MAG TPA: hypothetical protein DHW42_09435 [Candidatus Marinimicrobia bacterium]|nr:hypothetical protein [Candidatus Neomarinimicrobiota bacterium]
MKTIRTRVATHDSRQENLLVFGYDPESIEQKIERLDIRKREYMSSLRYTLTLDKISIRKINAI